MLNIFSKISDVGGWFAIIPAALIIFLLISAFFPLNNFYSKSCQKAGWGWKVLGIVLLGVSTFAIASLGGTTGSVILGGAGVALAFCSFAGFNFSQA
jgi:hypothetical protein